MSRLHQLALPGSISAKLFGWLRKSFEVSAQILDGAQSALKHLRSVVASSVPVYTLLEQLNSKSSALVKSGRAKALIDGIQSPIVKYFILLDDMLLSCKCDWHGSESCSCDWGTDVELVCHLDRSKLASSVSSRSSEFQPPDEWNYKTRQFVLHHSPLDVGKPSWIRLGGQEDDFQGLQDDETTLWNTALQQALHSRSRRLLFERYPEAFEVLHPLNWRYEHSSRLDDRLRFNLHLTYVKEMHLLQSIFCKLAMSSMDMRAC